MLTLPKMCCLNFNKKGTSYAVICVKEGKVCFLSHVCKENVEDPGNTVVPGEGEVETCAQGWENACFLPICTG